VFSEFPVSLLTAFFRSAPSGDALQTLDLLLRLLRTLHVGAFWCQSGNVTTPLMAVDWKHYHPLSSCLEFLVQPSWGIRRTIRDTGEGRSRRNSDRKWGQSLSFSKSTKGTWHLSKTTASAVGMTNYWLIVQGILNLKSIRR
jgi:hypothetical protein